MSQSFSSDQIATGDAWKNRRPRLMVNLEDVFKKRSKTVTWIYELVVDRVCRETSRTSLESGTQTITRGCVNPGVVRILAEARATDHSLVAELVSDGSVRKSEDEDARSRTGAPAPLVAQQAMDLEVADKQNTSCEILGGRPLVYRVSVAPDEPDLIPFDFIPGIQCGACAQLRRATEEPVRSR